jgi:hypothetical protein
MAKVPTWLLVKLVERRGTVIYYLQFFQYVSHLSLGILPATHYPNPKNPDPNPKNPNPHYPFSLRVANHKTRSFCGYFGLRTPVPEDPNPHIVFQSDLTSRLPVPTGHRSTPHSPVPTRPRPKLNSLRRSTPRLHRFITQPRRAPDPNSPWRLLTSSPLRINLAAGRRYKLPNSRLEGRPDDAPSSLWKP